jgi:death-on-curing protein
LHRPQSGYYDDLPDMAAALMESLLLNRPFMDGNKRVAFFLTDVFLRMNGYKLAVEAKPAPAFLVGFIEDTSRDRTALRDWIAGHLRRKPGGP